MKKLLFVLVLVAVLATGTVFADEFGIGVHGGHGGVGAGGGLNLAISGLYIYIDALGLNDNSMHLSGAVDFLFLFDMNLVSTLDFYIRAGIGAGIWGFDDSLGLAAAARLPIGLSWKPIPLLEIFFQAVPQIGLRLMGSDRGGSGLGLSSNFFGGNLGIRIWF
jgi:hypothetical protein